MFMMLAGLNDVGCHRPIGLLLVLSLVPFKVSLYTGKTT